MRIQHRYIFTVITVLLLISGSSGCRSNGGAWYNPNTYSFSNPFNKDAFAKDNLAPLFNPSGSMANKKPSLNASPNIDTPPGGYRDGTVANNSAAASLNPPDHWGQNQMLTQNSMASMPNAQGTGLPGLHNSFPQDTPSHPGMPHQGHLSVANQSGIGQTGFGTVASQNNNTLSRPPHASHPQPFDTQHHMAAQHAQTPFQYQPDLISHADSTVPFPYHATALQQHGNAPLNNGAMHANAMNANAMEWPGHQAPHGSQNNAHFGTMPTENPYAMAQQPGFAPHDGSGQQAFPGSHQGYSNDPVSTASPYNPYALPAGTGHNYGF